MMNVDSTDTEKVDPVLVQLLALNQTTVDAANENARGNVAITKNQYVISLNQIAICKQLVQANETLDVIADEVETHLGACRNYLRVLKDLAEEQVSGAKLFVLGFGISILLQLINMWRHW